MGCGNFFFNVLLTFSVALITHNIIISANSPLQQDLPGPSRSSSSVAVDPIIQMPMHRSRGKSGSSKRLFHTAVTASDSVYNTWQCRIMYYWFKKFQNEPGSEMGGFTRILHNGKPDEYMDEIPTFIAQPLPAGMDRGYIVLNRPWAFVQWLQQADIKEEYAYAVASAHHGVGNILYKDFMLQPPWDKEIGKKFIIHYTYRCDYNMKGELTYGKIGEWRFDKRSYDTVAPPRNLPMPPHGVPESVVTLVKMVNEATANIPSWGE